jgi:hypothetical protein
MGEWCGSEELEEFGYEYKRLAEACEDGQAPHRTAWPLTMRKTAPNAKQYATASNISSAVYIILALRNCYDRAGAQP